jgi:ribosomal protein S13
MELDEPLLAQLFRLKDDLISWIESMGNLKLQVWAHAWETEVDCIHPTITFLDALPDIQKEFLQKTKQKSLQQRNAEELVGLVAVMSTFTAACKLCIAGKLIESLDQAMQVRYWLGFYRGKRAQANHEQKLKGQRRHTTTREIRRLVVEYYIRNDLKSSKNTDAADEICKTQIIENYIKEKKLVEEYKNKKLVAPDYDTLTDWCSFIKRLLEFSQELTPWENLTKISADGTTQAYTREEFLQHKVQYDNGGIENYSQSVESHLVMAFVDANLKRAATKNECFDKATRRLVALGDMYVREIKKSGESVQEN